MIPSRWQQIEELYNAARECPPGERAALLEGTDPELRREVESLLAQKSSATPLDHPAWEGAASLLQSTVTQIAAGKQLGPYKIETPLGKGGMGEVFRATDTRLHRTVAIKILPRDKVADPERKKRFLQEARAASALNHPNIITLYDIASDSGTDYIVMECVPGKSLDKLISPQGLPLAEALNYAQQIASGLAAAHDNGIVHRDLKPANVVITPKGMAKVLDFGLAKLMERAAGEGDEIHRQEAELTEVGTVMGTVAYMSPEQASAKPVDHRTDIFSLGIILYEMLAGTRPFRGRSQVETMHGIIHDPAPPLPWQPPELQEILDKTLAKDANDRYQHAADLELDLRRFQKACESKSRSSIRDNPVPLQRRREITHRSRWWIATALAIAALGSGAWWTFQSKPHALRDGVTPSANHEANDQYELAMNFLAFQNDIPLARKTFARALELDPNFASARLQLATMLIIEIFNGYTNDEGTLYQAEEELHRAEQVLPGSDGLLLSTQSVVYLAQGRLDRIPAAKLEESWRKGGNPTWLVILRMLEGRADEALAISRGWLDRHPLENPTRMFLGETLRTQGDTAGAIQAQERALQQAPGNVTAAWFLTMAYLDEGKPRRARALLEGMRIGFEKNYMWRHAWAVLLAGEGKRNDALQAMDENTLKFAKLTWAVTATTADFYALNGDSSKAIEWLQLAIARGDERVSYFRRNPRLAKLRNDTRFQSLMKAVESRSR
jgi:serine/threonine protein kinase